MRVLLPWIQPTIEWKHSGKNVPILNMCMFPFLDFILYTIQYNDHLDITYIQLDILSSLEMNYIILEDCTHYL